MFIEMVEIAKFIPKESGKYLVKTISTGPLKTIRFLQADVTISEKSFSIDINNQIATHISKTKLC